MTLLDIARRRGVFVLAALALGVAVAACGSSSSTTGSSGSGSGSSTTPTTASRSGFNGTALRTCLKQHGVTLPSRPAGSGPPAGGGGGFFGGGGAGGAGGGRGGFFRNNPKFLAAFKACGGASFRGGARPGGRFQISHASIQQFVTCVRQHGYPQMPNPNFSGKGPIFPASIRTNAKFVAASRSCASTLRPGAGAGGASGGSSGGSGTTPAS